MLQTSHLQTSDRLIAQFCQGAHFIPKRKFTREISRTHGTNNESSFTANLTQRISGIMIGLLETKSVKRAPMAPMPNLRFVLQVYLMVAVVNPAATAHQPTIMPLRNLGRLGCENCRA